MWYSPRPKSPRRAELPKRAELGGSTSAVEVEDSADRKFGSHCAHAATVPPTARALHGLGPDVSSATARAGSPENP